MEKNTGCFGVEEARQYMGVGRTTMYELVRRADFPTVRIGKRIIIPKESLDRWLETQANKEGDGFAI